MPSAFRRANLAWGNSGIMVSNKPERRLSRFGNAARLRQGYDGQALPIRRGHGAQIGSGGSSNDRTASSRSLVGQTQASVGMTTRRREPEKLHPSPHLSPSHFHFSNRYTARIEIAVTHSKQTTVVLSNRYKKPSPRGVPSWLLTIRRGSGSRASPPRRTRRGAYHPTLRISNGYSVQTGFAVTPTKQTTVVLSNGYRKPSPRGVATWLRPSPHSTVLPGTHTQTGFAVTHSKQTTGSLSTR